VAVTDLVVFGTGDLARAVHALLPADARWRLRAFTVDRAHLGEPTVGGVPVVPFDEVAARCPPADARMLVALGYGRLNAVRLAKMAEARALGYRLATVVHPSSVVSPTAELGENCLVMEGNVIQPHARLGDGVVLWSANVVGHDAVLGAGCFVSSGVVIGGRTRIGEGSFLGMQSGVGPQLTLGRRCVVGAGALVLEDAPDESVFAGARARRRAVPSTRLRL
jgi:sugar O-acyltransferase (sialic acid O-acetyltransferase NeuD family)